LRPKHRHVAGRGLPAAPVVAKARKRVGARDDRRGADGEKRRGGDDNTYACVRVRSVEGAPTTERGDATTVSVLFCFSARRASLSRDGSIDFAKFANPLLKRKWAS
jgi:hypothetical protein